MQLLISDANILIDMEEGQLIKLMFQLPYRFSILDILFVDEMEDEHQYLQKLGLKMDELSGETIMNAMALIQRYTKASRNDCFALAIQEKCPLLTGDKALRDAAEKEAVIVKGTLWLVKQMIRQQLITVAQARGAYQRMKESGRRLPWPVAEAILQEIEKEDGDSISLQSKLL